MAGSSDEVYRVKESFAIPGPDGFLRTYAAGALISGSDRLATSHRAFLDPVANAVEKASAAPGERRSVRLPSAVRLQQSTEHNIGHAHKTGDLVMPHALPPEHPDSPASPFAPEQPAAGVVADDVPDEQNKAGAPKAAEVTEQAAKAAAEQQSAKAEEPAKQQAAKK